MLLDAAMKVPVSKFHQHDVMHFASVLTANVRMRLQQSQKEMMRDQLAHDLTDHS